MHDFFNYAGLHRKVWLYATPRYARQRRHGRYRRRRRPDAEGVTGTVYEVQSAAPTPDDRCASPARRRRGRGRLRRTGPPACCASRLHLWQPGDGYLYDLVVEVLDDDGAVLDSYRPESACARWRSTAPTS